MNTNKLKLWTRGLVFIGLILFLTACPGDDLPVETIIPETTKVPNRPPEMY